VTVHGTVWAREQGLVSTESSSPKVENT
jgi:hypothetical protein